MVFGHGFAQLVQEFLGRRLVDISAERAQCMALSTRSYRLKMDHSKSAFVIIEDRTGTSAYLILMTKDCTSDI